MYYDSRGHEITATDNKAVAACNAGVESYIRFRADAMGYLDDAIALEEGFVLPLLMKAWMLHSARNAKYAPKIAELVGQIESNSGEANSRENDLLAALKFAFKGHGIEAVTVLEGILNRHPTDLLSHRLAQFELFWNGRSRWMKDLTETAVPDWSEEIPGYATFLACRAFANEEAGFYEEAERCGRQSVELDCTEVWGAHSVAHVMLMKARVHDGIAWLDGLKENWIQANQMRHHLWWHYCLFLLEVEDHERVLSLLTTEVRNPESPLVIALPDAAIDIQNFSSLLIRLELRGIDVGDHWQALANICADRIDNCTNPFSNFHDIMVLAATGQFDKAEAMLANMESFSLEGEGSLVTAYRTVGLSAGRAVLSHRRRDYARVVELLSGVRHDLSLLGGSHAQRDVLFQILTDAAYRTGNNDKVTIFLNDLRRIGFDSVESRSLYRGVA